METVREITGAHLSGSIARDHARIQIGTVRQAVAILDP